MSLEAARKILGEEMSAKLTDDELQKLVWDLEAIARITIKGIINGEFEYLTTEKKNSKLK